MEVGEGVFGDDFNKNITELTPYEDRLWIGYGDANVNLGGEIPITFRSFSSANNPEVLIGLSGEEQFDRFRMLGWSIVDGGVDSVERTKKFIFHLLGAMYIPSKITDGANTTRLLVENMFTMS